MPRGVRKPPMTSAEKLAACEEKITKLTAELKSVKAEHKELLAKLETAQAEEIVKAFRASGKTAEEVLAFLNQESE